MMPYFLADVYFGLEPAGKGNGTTSGCGLPVVDSKPLFTPNVYQKRCACFQLGHPNTSISYQTGCEISPEQLVEAESAMLRLPPWSKLYVQVNLFALFVRRLLPLLRGPTILLTGQFNFPSLTALHEDERANFEAVLRSHRVVRWWTQSPVELPAGVSNAHKYRGLPYGVDHRQLSQYSECWAHAHPPKKTREVYYSPFSLRGRDASDARARLAGLPQYASSTTKLSYTKYCSQLAAARFVISPAGDRFECFRHWEAIGLGTVPVCDCPRVYSQIVPGGMLIASNSTELVELAQRPWLLRARYTEQQRQQRGCRREIVTNAVRVGFWRRQVDADLPTTLQTAGALESCFGVRQGQPETVTPVRGTDRLSVKQRLRPGW